MNYPARVEMIEVSPRDGLQNEPIAVPTPIRVELIEKLATAGLKTIEAGSFVSPERVPQMAGTEAVLAGLSGFAKIRFPVLVPNRRGLEAALAAGARDIALFVAASETFSTENLNMTIAESLENYTPIAAEAGRLGLGVRGYVSCAFGSPGQEPISPSRVAILAEELIGMGCRQVSLGDTFGAATPGAVRPFLEAVLARVPADRLAGHFHDTCGQALANILVAMDFGLSAFDSSVAGLGGCPFAPGAAGNVASEDLLYMLDGLGIATGVRLKDLLAAGEFICRSLGRPTRSQVAKALRVRKGQEDPPSLSGAENEHDP